MIENIKTMTDDEVINVINRIVTDNEDVELADLKQILAEASGRKLEKKYINIIAERIKAKIQPEPVEVKRKTEPAEQKKKPELKEETPKPTFDDVYNAAYYDDEEEEEYEKYPALSFLVGLYKVFAWILLVGIIVIAVVNSVLLFKGNIYLICGLMFGSIIIGLISFLGLYSAAEKIKVQIDVESHLRKLIELVNK